MKLKIFASVIGVHALAVIIIAYSGCQSTQSTKSAADTRMAPEAGYSEPETVYVQPDRPSSNTRPSQDFGTSYADDGLDSAFNSGSNMSFADEEEESEFRSPTRPAWESSSTGINEFREDEVLDPLESFNAPAAKEHTVQKGDSLWKISKEYGVSFKELLSANGLSKESTIFPGQNLIIPGGSSASRPSSSVASSSSQPSGTESYVVKRGDTLSGLATKFNTTVSDIKNANGLRGDTIRLEQKLTIPVNSRSSSGSKPSTSSYTPSSRSVSSKPVSSSRSPVEGDIVHVVKRGESISKIAQMYGVTSRQLMEDNGISDPTKLQAGAELQIRLIGAQSQVPAAAPVERTEYDFEDLTEPSRPEANVDTPDTFDEDYFDDFDDIPEVPVVQEE